MHIFPGLNYYQRAYNETFRQNPVQHFWKRGPINPLNREDPPGKFVDFFDDYASILTPFRKQIPLALGSHIHRMTYISPYSAKHPDLDLKILVTPSITPVYYNDPGFTVIHFKKDDNSDLLKLSEISLRFFSFSNIFMYQKPVWRDFEISNYLGIDVDSSE